jgi:hypothetical protein
MNYLAIIFLIVLAGISIGAEWKVHSYMGGDYLDTDDYVNPPCLSRVEIVKLFEENRRNPVLKAAVISGKCHIKTGDERIVIPIKCLPSNEIIALYHKYPDNAVLLDASIRAGCVIRRQTNDSNVNWM